MAGIYKTKQQSAIRQYLELKKNGYVTVTAVSKSGKKFSSEDARPFKKVIQDMLGEFTDACKDAFTELLS